MPAQEASSSWFGAELARIRATATATRAASRLLLSTLEGKKEVAHNTLQSTQAEIQKQREPIDKVRRPRLLLVPPSGRQAAAQGARVQGRQVPAVDIESSLVPVPTLVRCDYAQVLAHTKRWIDSQAAAADTVASRRRAGSADRWAAKMAWFEQTAAAVSPA